MSANTSTGQRERNTINIDSSTKILVNYYVIAVNIDNETDTNLPDRYLRQEYDMQQICLLKHQ